MELVDEAKKIIADIMYIVIATSDKDGSPWNSPLYSSYDEDYNFFWISSPDSQHSKNIQESGRVFLVIYDSSAAESTGRGVYIQARAQELRKEKDITHALKYHYGRKDKAPRPATDFLGEQPRRVYKAVPEKVWVNTDEKTDGHHVDQRVEVSLN